MLKKLFSKSETLESLINKSRHFGESYKVIGQVIPSGNTFKHDGLDISFLRAAVFLCVNIYPGEDDYHKVWESEEYNNDDDALNVLKSECRRISRLVNRRIEIISYDYEANKHIPIEIFNENHRAYLLAITNA